jgi:hybrid cluster-associated redox disulfide protein
MSSPPITPDQLVEEVLHAHPQAARVFIRHRMACVGCPMAPFMTVAEAAAAYDLPTERLLMALRRESGSSG